VIVKKALSMAHHVAPTGFIGQRTYQCPIEPHSAYPCGEGKKLTVYSSTQSPHYFQHYIAREFGLHGNVRVIKTYVGGGFGGKKKIKKETNKNNEKRRR